jgi:acyl-CoA thioester hydrolase
MNREPFRLRTQVRIYEVDTLRHLGGACYVQYAEQSRFACMQAAGVSVHQLLGDGIGPVNLQTTIRYHRELLLGDEVDVSCSWVWGDGKTYQVEHELRRADGELAAEVGYVSGLLDMRQRRLVPEPARELGSRAQMPALLGLPPIHDLARRAASADQPNQAS